MLNEQQETAKNLIMDWWKNKLDEKQVFVLAGYAGTGKTFLVNHIVKNEMELPEEKVAYVAPTGKAASVLIQRGAKKAITIHKLIYVRAEKEYKTEVNGKIIKSKKFEFIKKPNISNYKLIVVDETSMVEAKVMEDLLSFGIPLLCCGDIGQLPPVGKDNGLLKHPDYNLTQIVRQAEDNAIVKLATMAREGRNIPIGNYGNAIVIAQNMISESKMKEILMNADQILAGTNQTTFKINAQMKEYLGMKPKELNTNEKIICLMNNWDVLLEDDYSLVNGLIGYVGNHKIVDEKLGLGELDFKADFLDEPTENLLFDNNIFLNNEFKYDFHQQVYLMDDGAYQLKTSFQMKQPNETEAEYRKRIHEYAVLKRDAIGTEQINFFQDAWCITVHKSQGSEWKNVVVFDQSRLFNEPEKHLYTAITRAKSNLILIK